MGGHLGERAVVLGGGMAGLVTARVLADRYQQVLVVERDQIVEVTEPRRGVPQARHAHALLARGQQVLDELFPGLHAELTANGVLSGDLSGDLRWYVNGRQLRQADSGLLSVSAARPVLEAHVRARVLGLPNVEVREQTVIQGLRSSADGSRITGVRVAADTAPAGTDADSAGTDPAGESRGDGGSEVLAADLVVDATGRGSRTPVWLQELGYLRPAEDTVKVDLAYTSRFFRLDSDPFGTDLAINPVATPANPRGAFFGKFPDRITLLSLTGLLGDHPPRDHEGFLEYARSLSPPEIYQSVRTAEPLGEIASFRFPASVRRRYDRLRQFPAGLLVIGDGVCSFNPVYGQGMTVAAMEAAALADHLRDGEPRPLQFFREINPIIDVPWEISAGADLGFPGVEGKRTLKVKFGNAYMSRLHTAAQLDGRFTKAFFRVAGLVDPPQALMRPGLVFGVLRTARRAPDAGPAPRPADQPSDTRKGLAA